jgi:hypothetical protein
MDLVAEGVEDAATAESLAGFGCDIEQGWLYSKAVPARELEQWLDEHPEGLDEPGEPAEPEGLDEPGGVPRQRSAPAERLR